VNRRKILIAGAAMLGVGAAGVGWHAVRRGVFNSGTGPAYAAWRQWPPRPEEGARGLVRAAVLAASPHNTQPWLFRIADSRIDLFADPARNLGTIDPFLREMHMGLGCALENLLLAARAAGYRTALTLLPAGPDAAHTATLQLDSGEPDASPLFAAIPRRHTNRGGYDPVRPVGQEVLKALGALGLDLPDVAVLWFTSEAERGTIGELIVAATRAIIADRQQSADSARWLRMSWDKVQRHRDGITLDAAGLPPLIRGAAKLLPELSHEESDAAWLKATRETHVATAMGYGLVVARRVHDNGQRLQGGRFWQRMHLWAAGHALAVQPLNQIPERADREASLGIEPVFGTALRDLVGDPAWEALMPFRIGYPLREALPSPRRAVEDVLLEA
jgi:hypothetical protein